MARPLRRSLVAALAALPLLSCAKDPAAGIVLALQTDIVVPDGIDAVALVLSNEATGAIVGTPLTRSVIAGSNRVRFPSTLVLETAFDEPTFSVSKARTPIVPQIRVSLIGIHSDDPTQPLRGAATVLRRVVTTMPTDGMHSLRISLDALDQGSVAPLGSGPATGAAFEANYRSIKSNCSDGAAFDRIGGACVRIPELNGDTLPLVASEQSTTNDVCFSTDVFMASDVERIAQSPTCAITLFGPAKDNSPSAVAVGYERAGVTHAIDYATDADVAASGVPAKYSISQGTLTLGDGLCDALKTGAISTILVAPSPAKRSTQSVCSAAPAADPLDTKLAAVESFSTYITTQVFDFFRVSQDDLRVYGVDSRYQGLTILDVHQKGGPGAAGVGFGIEAGPARLHMASASKTIVFFAEMANAYKLGALEGGGSATPFRSDAGEMGAFYYDATTQVAFHSAKNGQAAFYATDMSAPTAGSVKLGDFYATSISRAPTDGHVLVTQNDGKIYEYSRSVRVGTYELSPSIRDLRAALPLPNGRVVWVGEGDSGSSVLSAVAAMSSASPAYRFGNETTHSAAASPRVAYLPASGTREELLFVGHGQGLEAIGFRPGTFTPYHYGWVARGAGIAAVAAADEGGKACVFFANTQPVKVLGKEVVAGQHRRCF